METEQTESLGKSLNLALAETMSKLSSKWEKERQYKEKEFEQVKSGKHKYWFGCQGKMFRYRSEWDLMWKAWQDKKTKSIHINYGLGIEHKQMSAKIQRKIVTIDEEIQNLHKKKNRMLKKHWKDAKEITNKQILNRFKQLIELRKELGML